MTPLKIDSVRRKWRAATLGLLHHSRTSQVDIIHNIPVVNVFPHPGSVVAEQDRVKGLRKAVLGATCVVATDCSQDNSRMDTTKPNTESKLFEKLASSEH